MWEERKLSLLNPVGLNLVAIVYESLQDTI